MRSYVDIAGNTRTDLADYWTGLDMVDTAGNTRTDLADYWTGRGALR